MMKSIQTQVRIVLSPSKEQYTQIRIEYAAQTGLDNPYEYPELWDKLCKAAQTEWILENVTFDEAQAFAEPFRIANPGQHVSLYNDDTSSFIGNTTWNDQMNLFWEYPVYTIEGEKIKQGRLEEAREMGLIASWE